VICLQAKKGGFGFSLEHYLRINIGSVAQMKMVLKVLKAVLEKGV